MTGCGNSIRLAKSLPVCGCKHLTGRPHADPSMTGHSVQGGLDWVNLGLFFNQSQTQTYSRVKVHLLFSTFSLCRLFLSSTACPSSPRRAQCLFFPQSWILIRQCMDLEQCKWRAGNTKYCRRKTAAERERERKGKKKNTIKAS